MGGIENSFAHLARYYELRQKSKDKAIGALIYPLILLHAGLVLPEMPRLFTEDNTSGVVRDILLHMGIAWAILGGLGFVVWWAMKLADTSKTMDGLLNAIPLVGGVRRHWALGAVLPGVPDGAARGLPDDRDLATGGGCLAERATSRRRDAAPRKGWRRGGGSMPP